MDDKKNLPVYDKDRSIIVTYDKKGIPSVKFVVGGFPSTQFDKWYADCKLNFGDCRWAKLMNDHEKARMYDILVTQQHEEMQQEEQPKQEEKKKSIPLLGGGELIEKEE